MHSRVFALVLTSLGLTIVGLFGCGGGEGGCSGAGEHPNGAYAGAYTAVFNPKSGSSGALNPLSFDLAVSDDGTVAGTVVDAVPEPDVQISVTGYAFDVVGCAPTGRGVRLNAVLPQPRPALVFIKHGRGSIVGTLNGPDGTLVISRKG